VIYYWINQRRVERLAGDDVEKLAVPVRTPHPLVVRKGGGE
jgi:hypothetical protein